MLVLIGIQNCNQVKKSLKWRNDYSICLDFDDFKKQYVTKNQVTTWRETPSWKVLLNKRSRTYKELSEIQKTNISQS